MQESRRRLTLALALLILIACSPWTSTATDIHSLAAQNLISQETINTLHTAREQGYSIRILLRTSPAPARLIVIMGERHIFKTRATEQAGNEVIDQFSTCGVEGAECHGTFGKFVECCCFPLLRCYYGAASLLTGTGSSIDAAYAKERRQQPPSSLRMGIQTELTADTSDPLLQTQSNFRVISLEQNHESNCGEIFATGLCCMLCTSSLTAITLGLSTGAPQCLASTLPYAEIALLGCLLSGTIGPSIEEKLPLSYSTAWTRWLGIYGWVEGRNHTIVKNIAALFEEHPEYTSLLVIVGKMHGAGIQRALLREHGFEEISFPGAPRCSCPCL